MVQSSPETRRPSGTWRTRRGFLSRSFYASFCPATGSSKREFPWLFNSYYQSFAAFPEKSGCGLILAAGARGGVALPGARGLGIEAVAGRNPEPEALKRIELGAHHEEQHQELLLTDILHAFFTNPLRPAYLGGAAREKAETEICC